MKLMVVEVVSMPLTFLIMQMFMRRWLVWLEIRGLCNSLLTQTAMVAAQTNAQSLP